jgi:histidyl-tRNA synthetase
MIEQVKGTQNIYENDAEKFLYVRNKFFKIFKKSGYSYLQTPHLEYSELFEKSIGENSEIVSKQMYQFNDKGGRSLVLRPEGTSSIVRYHSQNQKELTNQYSYFGQMFRYENPQKNRYREFTQGGIEIIGNIDTFSDFQIINDSIRFLNELSLKFSLEINTIGSIEDRKNYTKDLYSYFKLNEDQLSDDSKNKLELNTLRILDSNNAIDIPIINNAPDISSYINEGSIKKYDLLKTTMTQNDIAFKENSRLVRGLDYYNDLTFEFVNDDGLVLGGGGRYDRLADILNIGTFNGVGVAFGIERIMNSISIKIKPPEIYIIGVNLEKITTYCKLLENNDLNYFKPPRLSKINTQYKNAKNLDVKYVINTDEDTIKDLVNNTSIEFNIEVLIDN